MIYNKMNRLVALVVIISVLGLVVDVPFTFAQSEPTRANPYALAQIVLRDPNGKLVGYVETDKVISLDSVLLNKYLDTISDKKIISIDGKNFQMIQIEWNHETFSINHAEGIYSMIPYIDGSYQDVLDLKHDGYQVTPGDSIQIYYTFIRPLH